MGHGGRRALARFPFVFALLAACSTELPARDGGGIDVDFSTDARAPTADAEPPPVDAEAGSAGLDARPPDPADGAQLEPPDGAPPEPPDAIPPPPPRQAFFTRPTGDAPDGTLEGVLIGLLDQAEPGSEVRAAWFTFSRTRMAAAFVAAANRGVDVRIVLGNTNVHEGCTDWQAVADLKAGLGPRNVVICRPCEDGGGCIGTGISHNKFAVFSALADGSRDVVVQSSANLTNPQLHEHNNLVVMRNDAALFAAYRRYWDDLAGQALDPDYYHVEDGEQTRVYFYPRAEGDTVVGIIGNVDCAAGARIRLVMAYFTDARLEIARALADARRTGCTVHALLRQEPPDFPGDQVLATLRSGGVTVQLFPLVGERTIHSKYLLIDGAYAGDALRKLVWTGSHNYTGPALTANDETLLRVDDESVFLSFEADFRAIQAAIEAL